MNWFGTKVGTNASGLAPINVPGAAGGVGKYLNTATAKRPLEAADGDENKSKKKKLGFGNFDGW
jgi:hypothetical protein